MPGASTIGFINIGMGVQTAGLAKGLKGAAGQVKGFGSTLGSGIGSAVGALAAGFGAFKVAGGIKDAIFAASDLNEQVSKSDVVFGDASATVKAEADKMAAAFGFPKTQFIDAASSIGLIGKASGLAQGEAAKLGVDFAKAAADASSFYNVPLDEALMSIRSGLVGETEPLRRFGVLLNADAVEAEAARLGLQRVGKEFTEGAKVQARASLITRGLSDAHGDLARTMTSPANAMRMLGGQVTNLSADIGQALLPAFSSVLGVASTAVTGLTGLFESNKTAIGGWIAGAMGALSSFGSTVRSVFQGTVLVGFSAIGAKLAEFPAAIATAMGPETTGMILAVGQAIQDGLVKAGEWAMSVVDGIGFAWRNLPALVEVAALQIQEKIINVGEVFAAWGTNLQLIGNYIATNWRQLAVDGVNAVASAFQNLGTNLFNLGSAIVTFLQNPTQGFQFNWTPLLEGFQATAAQLPEMVKPHLTSLQGEIDAKLSAIGELEAGRAAEIGKAVPALATAAVAGAAPAALATASPAAKAEFKSAGAAQLGSKEARSSILAFRGGGAGGIKSVAKNTEKQVAEQKETNKILRDKLTGSASADEPYEIPA